MPLVTLPRTSVVLENLVGGAWEPSKGPLLSVTTPYTGAEYAPLRFPAFS